MQIIQNGKSLVGPHKVNVFLLREQDFTSKKWCKNADACHYLISFLKRSESNRYRVSYDYLHQDRGCGVLVLGFFGSNRRSRNDHLCLFWAYVFCLKLSIFVFLALTHFKSTQRVLSEHSDFVIP